MKSSEESLTNVKGLTEQEDKKFYVLLESGAISKNYEDRLGFFLEINQAFRNSDASREHKELHMNLKKKTTEEIKVLKKRIEDLRKMKDDKLTGIQLVYFDRSGHKIDIIDEKFENLITMNEHLLASYQYRRENLSQKKEDFVNRADPRKYQFVVYLDSIYERHFDKKRKASKITEDNKTEWIINVLECYGIESEEEDINKIRYTRAKQHVLEYKSSLHNIHQTMLNKGELRSEEP